MLAAPSLGQGGVAGETNQKTSAAELQKVASVQLKPMQLLAKAGFLKFSSLGHARLPSALFEAR